MKAKQFLALFLALLMTMSVLVSCGGGDETESESKQETQGTDDPVVTDPLETEISDDLGDINFKDNENPVITFFLRDGYVWETYVEELTENVLHDQIYWRNQEVQRRLGIEIAQIAQGCGWSSASGKYTEWNETLRNAVQTETHDFDAAMIYTGVSSSLGIEGIYMELTQLDNISLEKPWWNQNLLKEATIYGSLYFASGSIAMSQLRDANLFWYNKDMYKEFVAPTAEKDIYQVVRDGEWTIDYLYDMVSNIWQDNDSNGELSSGDTVGYVGGVSGSHGGLDSWLYALGCDLTKIDESIGEPVAAFYSEHTVQAFEKAVNFHFNNPGVFVGYDGGTTGDTSFSNGNGMIMLGRFSSGEGFGNYTFSYGILPVPKFDTDQESYRAIPEVTSSMVTIISTVEATRVDMVAATVELLAAEGYKQVKPAYIDVVLKSHSSNSPEDAEMVQLILDSMVYSFGWIFSSTHMGDMGKTFRYMSPTADFTNLYETRKEKYESMIDLLIDGFASIA